jgi:hypothetical protein
MWSLLVEVEVCRTCKNLHIYRMIRNDFRVIRDLQSFLGLAISLHNTTERSEEELKRRISELDADSLTCEEMV